MKYILSSILVLVVCSTINGRNIEKSDSSKNNFNDNQVGQDTISPYSWLVLEDIITPNGISINYVLDTDSTYHLEWGSDGNLRVLQNTFYRDAPPTSEPSFIGENEKYLVLRFGCGTSCWVGIFLPLDNDSFPHIINYYYDYDLDNDLVAYLDSEEELTTISVKNLETEEKYSFKMESDCLSAIPTYCIDYISIQNGILYYKWIPDTYINSDEGVEKEIKIK